MSYLTHVGRTIILDALHCQGFAVVRIRKLTLVLCSHSLHQNYSHIINAGVVHDLLFIETILFTVAGTNKS